MANTVNAIKEEKLKVLTWIIRALMALSITMTSWFLSQAWEKINENAKDISELKLIQAESKGQLFTASDWATAKMLIDNEKLAMDRRIIRLEESIPVIKESLIDIKQTIQKK